MDGYIEVVVPQKMTFEVQAKRFILTCLPLIAAIFLIRLPAESIFKVIVYLLAMGLAYLAYKMFMNFYVEWEYTFVTNEVSFAKITNKSKRKELLTCLVKDTVVLVKSTDKEHLNLIPKDAKKYVFLSGTGADHYIWVTKDKNGHNVSIAFEPNDKMLESMRKLARDRSFI